MKTQKNTDDIDRNCNFKIKFYELAQFGDS